MRYNLQLFSFFVLVCIQEFIKRLYTGVRAVLIKVLYIYCHAPRLTASYSCIRSMDVNRASVSFITLTTNCMTDTTWSVNRQKVFTCQKKS